MGRRRERINPSIERSQTAVQLNQRDMSQASTELEGDEGLGRCTAACGIIGEPQ